MIEEKIAHHQIKKQVFLAEKGDVFIWHANLFHGGEPHINKAKTRKSMVFHYFREGDICYHEITQRPALMKSFMLDKVSEIIKMMLLLFAIIQLY